MAKRKNSRPATAVRRTKADVAFPLYYDEDRLYGRTSARLVTKTVVPISGKGELFPQIADNTIPPNGVVSWYLNGPQGTSFRRVWRFRAVVGTRIRAVSRTHALPARFHPPAGFSSGPYPQNLVQTYRAGGFCGSVHDHTVIGGTAFENDYTVAIAGFTS